MCVIEDSKHIQGKKAYTELSTQKSGVFFTTKKLKELSVDHAQAREQYERVQSGLVREVVGIACEHLLFIPYN